MQKFDSVFEHSLVAKLSTSRPKMDELRAHIEKYWDLKNCPICSLIDLKHVLIKVGG